MDFVRQYSCHIIADTGGRLELFIPELKSGSGSGVSADEIELSNYQCFRVVVKDTVLVSAYSEMITAAKVLDKCDGDLQFWNLH